MKRVLLIEDLSCYGKCSMTVALPIFSIVGIEGIPLPTAIFSSHTGVSKEAISIDFSSFMEEFLNHFSTLGLEFDAILMGYSFGEEQIRILDAFFDKSLSGKKAVVLIDPAMADHGRMYGKLPPNYPKLMRKLIHKADIITPNLTEELLLAKQDYTKPPQNMEGITSLLQELYARYQKDIIITGIKLEEDLCVVGISGGKMIEYKEKWLEKTYSGTGDAFASIFLATYLKEKSFEQAMIRATKLTSEAVKNSIKNHREHLFIESILGKLVGIGDRVDGELAKNCNVD